MRVVFFTDIHVNPNNEMSTPCDDARLPKGAATTLLVEALNSMEWVAEKVRELKPDYAVCGGDTVHTQGWGDSLTLMTIDRGSKTIAAACEEAGTKLRWMVGNHDMYKDSVGSHVHTLPFVPGLVEKITDEGDLLLIPYTEDYEAVQRALTSYRGSVVLTHLDYQGARYGGPTSAASKHGLDPATAGHRLFVNGHYHHPQQLGNVVMAGSLMYHSFQDQVGNVPRGLVVITDNVSVDWVENPCTSMYHTIYGDTAQEVESQIIEYTAKNRADRTYLRVVQKQAFDLDLSHMKPLFKKIKHVDMSPRKAERVSSVDFLMDPMSVVSTYLQTLEDASTLPNKLDIEALAYGYLQEAMEASPRTEVDLRIVSWSVKNFMLIEEASVDVGPGLTLVEAVNLDSSAGESNGSGKSALFEAILWALYGRTLRGIKNDSIIRRKPTLDDSIGEAVEEGCVCSVTFQRSGSTYVVTRGRGHKKYKNKLIVTRDGIEISPRIASQAQEHLEGILGISYDEATQALFLGGGSDVRFTKISDVERKDLIEGLIGVSVYADAGALTKESADSLGRRVAEAKYNSSALANEIRVLNETCLQQQEQLAALMVDKKAEKDQLSQQRLALLAEKETVEKWLASTIDPPEEILLWKSTVSELTSQIDTLRHSDESDLLAKRGVLSEAVIRLSNLNGKNECPTCLSSIDCVSTGNHLLGSVEDLKATNESLKLVQSKLQTLIGERTKTSNAIASLEGSVKAKRDSAKQRVTSLISSVSSLTAQIDKTVSDETVERWKSIVEQTKLTLQSKLSDSEEVEHGLRELEGGYANLTFLQKMFSPTEIRSLVLDRALAFVNQQLLQYSDTIISGEIKVQLSSITATKTAGDKSKIDIVVTGSEDSYEGSSSGQKRRIDLCIQLALYDLLRYFRGSSNILVVDEMDGHLDQKGVARLVLALSSLSRSVFLVTHNQGLRALLSGQSVGRRIVITRESGKSTLEVE